ncbi:hypothetical protein JJG61_005594 [Salmonella enterica subsp. enterica serovar Panama]|nr:hypothetical protein [Salmonella enterica subsp. enterica serovar Panama]
MACVNVHCPRSGSALVYRHGKKPARLEHFRC